MYYFIYGTLMNPEIYWRITGESLNGSSATLHGYKRHSLRSLVFPAIVSNNKSYVDGILVYCKKTSVEKKLDVYEGSMYTKKTVSVTVKGNSIHPVLTYVLNSRYRSLILEKEWNFNTFESKYLRCYLKELFETPY